MSLTKQIARPTKIDWLGVRKWYLEHRDTDYPDVAREFGVSLTTVKKRGAQEGWLELRRIATAQAEIKVFNGVVDQLAQLSEEHATRFKVMQDYVQRRLVLAMAKMQQAENEAKKSVHVDVLKTTVPIIDDHKLMSPQQINFLSSALKESIFGERIARGLPTTVLKSENDINVSNPYSGYTVDQLQQMLNATSVETAKKYESISVSKH